MSILFTFMTRFGAAIFNLLISILVSRELGNTVKGDHSLFIASVALLQLFTNLFGGPTLVYLASRHHNRQLAVLSSLWSILVIVPVWAIILFTGLLPNGYALSILVSSLFFAVWSNLGFLLLGKQKNAAYNTLQFLHPLLTTLLTGVGIFHFRMGLEAFAHGYLASQVINLLLAFYFLQSVNEEAERDTTKHLVSIIFKHGFYIQLANFTQFFNYRLLYFLIDHFFGRAFLGVYSNAQSLAESVWMVTRSISTIQFSKISNSSDDRYNRTLTRQYVSMSFIISTVCLVVLLVIPPHFYSLLFGNGFENISNIIFLLAPGILFLSISNIFAHYFAGTGQNKVNFTGSFINLLCLLAAFFIIRNYTDSAAAPISASIAYGSALAYHYWRYSFSQPKSIRS